MPLGLHWPELIILVAVALLIFGPKRLPEMGSAMGKTIKEFQKSMKEVTNHDEAAPAEIPPASTPVAQQIPAAPAQPTVASAESVEHVAEPIKD